MPVKSNPDDPDAHGLTTDPKRPARGLLAKVKAELLAPETLDGVDELIRARKAFPASVPSP
jgi:hypothetical protein